MTRTVADTDAVVRAFVAGDTLPSRTATVNAGGARSRVSQDAGRLYSYRTAVAHRDPTPTDVETARTRPIRPTFRVTTSRYSVTTDRLMRDLAAALRSAGYAPAGPAETGIVAAVPGRWGGAGPAWASDPYPTVPCVLWTDAADPRAIAWAEHCDAIMAADAADRAERAERRRLARERKAAGLRPSDPPMATLGLQRERTLAEYRDAMAADPSASFRTNL